MAEKKKVVRETPLMKQFNEIKGKYPDAILLFRVGDFYETFGEDAIRASKILGIVLTKRRNGDDFLELAGFPHHSLDNYLPKLVRAGERVAICDQLEDPKMTKSIVKRGVTELVTPGVSYNDQTLSSEKNNFLACIHSEKDNSGIAFLDISTGEFFIAEGGNNYIDKLIQSFQPSEIIYQKRKSSHIQDRLKDEFYTYPLEDWVFKPDFANETLTKHFETNSLKGFGVDGMKLGIIAAGVAFHYLSETEHDKIKHITKINRIQQNQFVWLDKFTIRNLELVHSQHSNAKTLLDVIDNTASPMGSRLMNRWIVLPLVDQIQIESRLDKVEFLVKKADLSSELTYFISQIGDLERLISKVSVARVNPKELVKLKNSLKIVNEIKGKSPKELSSISTNLVDCSDLIEKIEHTLLEDPGSQVGKGNIINFGINEELDELRNISTSSKEILDDICARESEATGIPSLKIGFNNVFGYYIEVTNTHKDKAPEEWIRKQTLRNAERYITEELKTLESKILGAEDKIHQIESRLLNEIINWCGQFTQTIQQISRAIAELDCLLTFAQNALKYDYCKPEILADKTLTIKNGRHPVIEHQLPIGEKYISNDVFMDDETHQILMITGPNMSGKSALLRQTALIVLMAQMGSYVPCSKASIGIVDKIFTRVGASDNISSGESTFMVEMNETASILNNLSERSLILLDEIGRGTSTYDGISIAWSIADFIHEQPIAKAKTLFATHYHELNEMSNAFDRIKNYNVSIAEKDGKVIFLRKLKEGGSEHSFGIHVAKLAGMPQLVVNKADQLLKKLEANREENDLKSALPKKSDMQLSIFQLDDPILMQIKDEINLIDINTLTPVEALMKLHEIKKMVSED
jgi:DNA mismatch repair protein MutS